MPSLIRFFDLWSCRIAEIDQEEGFCESAVFLFHALAQSDFCFGLPARIDYQADLGCGWRNRDQRTDFDLSSLSILDLKKIELPSAAAV